MLTREIEGLFSVREALGDSFHQAVLCLLRCQGTIICTGIGKSGLIAKKVSSTLCSIGSPSVFLHPVEAVHGDIGIVKNQDVVIAFSNSGETRELVCEIQELLKYNCKIIAVTGGLNSQLVNLAHYTIQTSVPCEACSLNVLPTSSTTAALAIGDALAVCIMQAKRVNERDFFRFHPGGSLGWRLSQTLNEVMTVDHLPIVSENEGTHNALVIMNEAMLGTLFVIDDDGRLKGIVTDGDIRRHVVQGSLVLDGPVSKIMTSNPIKVSRIVSVAHAIEVMERHAITVLPVTNDAGKLLGVVHIHDLLGRGELRIMNIEESVRK